MTPERVEQILSALFDRAKDADEFEYACTLLRFQGMEDAGWDPLVETQFLFDEIGSLLEAPLRDETRVRLGLLLYSHLTEVDAIYMTIANLLAVTRGERYSLDPFGDLYRPRGIPRYEQLPPSANSVVKRRRDDATTRRLLALTTYGNSSNGSSTQLSATPFSIPTTSFTLASFARVRVGSLTAMAGGFGAFLSTKSSN